MVQRELVVKYFSRYLHNFHDIKRLGFFRRIKLKPGHQGRLESGTNCALAVLQAPRGASPAKSIIFHYNFNENFELFTIRYYNIKHAYNSYLEINVIQ